MKRLASAIRTIARDFAEFAGHTVRIAHISVLGLAGAAMFSWGVAMVYTPAGWISGGLFLCAFAYELATRAGERAAAELARREP